MSESSTDVVDVTPSAAAVAVRSTAEPFESAVRLAIKEGKLDIVERLLAVRRELKNDARREGYDRAFTAFKAEAVRIFKNKGVGDGPLKGKRYAELFQVVNAITPALSKHGLSMSWAITKDDKDWIEVTCTLKHVEGHSESVSMGGPPDTGGAKNAIQARASTVSYLERYTAKAITGLSEQEDDDDGRGGDDRGPEAQAAAALAEQWLDEARAAAMNGDAALRAWWERAQPPETWWAPQSKALRAAAKQADKDAGR